jgi:flagellar protein FlaJ
VKAKSFAEEIDRKLPFALKDMMVEIKSGLTLYDALLNIARSDYGLVSKEIRLAVKAANAGIPLTNALKRVAQKTQSAHFRRVLWQIITAIQSGASVEPALESAIKMINEEQEEKIKKYASDLNLIVLIYMLLASSLPAMTLPFLMILICFVSIQIDIDLILKIFSLFIIFQVLIIGFVQSSRPLPLK